MLAVDDERKRLSLEISNAGVIDLMSEDTILSGRVTKVVQFGAFVELPPGIDALLHNSEIAADREIAEGEDLLVRIIRIDHGRGRISIATEPRLPEDAPSKYAHKTRAEIGEPVTAEDRDAEFLAVRSALREAVAEFVRQQFPADTTSISVPRLAIAVRKKFGAPVTDDWLGHKRFGLMVPALVPEVRVKGTNLWLGEDRPVGEQAQLDLASGAAASFRRGSLRDS